MTCFRGVHYAARSNKMNKVKARVSAEANESVRSAIPSFVFPLCPNQVPICHHLTQSHLRGCLLAVLRPHRVPLVPLYPVWRMNQPGTTDTLRFREEKKAKEAQRKLDALCPVRSLGPRLQLPFFSAQRQFLFPHPHPHPLSPPPPKLPSSQSP